MPYRIRITRPEHPQCLLLVNLAPPGQIASYQEVFRGSEATRFEALEFAKAIVQQLRDARHDSELSAIQVAWAFKVRILRFEPWKKWEPTAEEYAQGMRPIIDEQTAPDDWARRMIRGATLDILSQKGGVVEQLPFEVPADFDVETLEPLDYVYKGTQRTESEKPFFAGRVDGTTRPKY